MNDDLSGRSGEEEARPEPDSRAIGGRLQIVDLDFLRALIAAVDESGIDSVEISRGGTRIRVSKTATTVATVTGGANHSHSFGGPPPSAAPTPEPAAPPPPPPVPVSNLVEVTSPMVGTFYRAPAPEAPSYVEVGARVSEGQTLCILEAMKLMNELESEVDGIVREICVDNSEPVEYGQVLFRIEPDA